MESVRAYGINPLHLRLVQTSVPNSESITTVDFGVNPRP